MNSFAKRSLIAKLKLLGLVIVLAIIKYNWPQQTKPGAPADENTLAWLAADSKLPKHPCESQKAYLQRKYFKGPSNNYFVDNED